MSGLPRACSRERPLRRARTDLGDADAPLARPAPAGRRACGSGNGGAATRDCSLPGSRVLRGSQLDPYRPGRDTCCPGEDPNRPESADVLPDNPNGVCCYDQLGDATAAVPGTTCCDEKGLCLPGFTCCGDKAPIACCNEKEQVCNRKKQCVQCPKASQCGPECCKKDETCCGQKCCKQDQFCFEKELSVCCNERQRGCRQRDDKGSVVRAFCCPKRTRCCGSSTPGGVVDCCGPDQICDLNTGKCRCSKDTKPCGQYACCEKGKQCCPSGLTCCTSKKECCGEHCCDLKNEHCCGDRCCSNVLVCGRRKGENVCCQTSRLLRSGFCCPVGTVPSLGGCCPPSKPGCCSDEVVAPLPRKGYVCVNSELVKR